MPDMIDDIVKILNTFTDEARDAALKKAAEVPFNVAAGIVSLDESFINLFAARDLLRDAIEHRKLIQLPITVQISLQKTLVEISRALVSMSGGTDEVQNLTKAIEDLNVSIWQYGLHNLSKEVLGYQTKMNQLKRQELDANKLTQELSEGLAVKRQLDEQYLAGSKIINELMSSAETAKQTIGDIAQTAQKASDITAAMKSTQDNSATQLQTFLDSTQKSLAEQVVSFEQKATASHATISKLEEQSTQLVAATKASNAEVVAIEPKVKEFFGEIAKYRTEMQKASDLQIATAAKWEKEAIQRIEQNQKATDDFLEELNKIDTEIKRHLQNAVGASLFHSFGQRQMALANSKDAWFKRLTAALVACFIIGMFVVIDLAIAEHVSYTPAFFLKLSLTLPFIFGVYFCAAQYTRERKLEEEYAFKSNISVSLVAYRDLVEKLVAHDVGTERQQYTEFMIGAIQEIFRPPTALPEKKTTDLPVDKVVETALDGATEIVKAVKKANG